MTVIHCVARFKAKTNKLELLVKSLQELIPLTLAESGCLNYALTKEVPYDGSYDDAWDICLIELWKTRADFDIHCNKPYIKDFFIEIAPNLVEKADVRLYSPI